MKHFKQHILESSVLMNLIDKYDDPYSFLAAAMDAMSAGKLKLKERGAANARELIAAWNKVKKNKIKLKEAVEYIAESRSMFVKGWTQKNKIISSTGEFNMYHIKQVVLLPRKFGLNEKKLLKILEDWYDDMSAPNPEEEAKKILGDMHSGVVDNNPPIEEYLFKKGYCRFVIDKTHGSVEGQTEKHCRESAKVLDDNYLPYERNGFKLFEVKPVKPFKPKYITSKYDWDDWVQGKAKRKYVSPMAQFRESVEYVIWGIPPKDKDETLLLTTGRDGKRITKKSDAMKLLKLLTTKHGVKKARIQELDVEVDPSDMFRNPFGEEVDEGVIKSFKDFLKKKDSVDVTGWKAKIHKGKHPDVPDVSSKGNILFAVNPKTGEEEHIASGNLSKQDINKFVKMYGLVLR